MEKDCRAILSNAIRRLKSAGIETPQLDARLLLAHSIGRSSEWVFSHPEYLPSDAELIGFELMIERREKREPVSRIRGWREFWGREFFLSSDTLDPRPDSETMIEAVLGQGIVADDNLRLLDLGTGTGCILLTLLSEIANSSGVGIDLIPGAIETASQNARRLGLSKRVEFVVSSWFSAVGDGKFNVITANPPYIPSGEIASLSAEVNFDPFLALDGGKDGLDAYRAITEVAGNFLTRGGILALETGFGQAMSVAELCREHGMKILEIRNDLGKIPRIVVVTLQ